MSFPLPFPWVPGTPGAGLGDDQIAERIQQNFDALAIAIGQQAQATGWVTLSLENSWVAFDSGTTPAYRIDGVGLVTLRGRVKDGSSATANITNLPAGARPDQTARFGGVANNAFCFLQVTDSGDVNAPAGGSTTWTSLDDIQFRAG